MIIGALIRNIKTYSGTNYIPLTVSNPFCGLVGENGIGKSSVLEAFDSLLNDKPQNINIAARRSGRKASPYIVPIFSVKSSELTEEARKKAKMLHDALLMDHGSGSMNSANLAVYNKIKSHLDSLPIDDDTYYIPLGKSDKGVTCGIFNTSKLFQEEILNNELFSKIDLTSELDTDEEKIDSEEDSIHHEDSLEIKGELTSDQLSKKQALPQDMFQQFFARQFDDLFEEIKSNIQYVYIPKEIDSVEFTKLEKREIQTLMGSNLNSIIEGIFGEDKIKEINSGLNSYLDELSERLGEYKYKLNSQKQRLIRKAEVYSLIVEAFFNIRTLHKKHQVEDWVPMINLSSGEKQRAIIDLVENLLSHNHENGKNLIVAIDEPESSLHVSACFEQMSKLYKISELCQQVIFSTHWYGFFPTINNGYFTLITKQGDERVCSMIPLENYREAMRHEVESAQKARVEVPFDIKIKSTNDLVQSVIMSITKDEPYHWLFCEGSSEKIYLDYYLSDLVKNNNLKIVPVGGASEISKIYSNLRVLHNEYKKEINGNVFLMIDTDPSFVEIVYEEMPKIKCYRLYNDNNKTLLLRSNDKKRSTKTEIEDVLDGNVFIKTLMYFKSEYPEMLDFINEKTVDAGTPSYYALDITRTQSESLTNFFDSENNKFLFAKKYISLLNDKSDEPSWISEIRRFFNVGK